MKKNTVKAENRTLKFEEALHNGLEGWKDEERLFFITPVHGKPQRFNLGIAKPNTPLLVELKAWGFQTIDQDYTFEQAVEKANELQGIIREQLNVIANLKLDDEVAPLEFKPTKDHTGKKVYVCEELMVEGASGEPVPGFIIKNDPSKRKFRILAYNPSTEGYVGENFTSCEKATLAQTIEALSYRLKVTESVVQVTREYKTKVLEELLKLNDKSLNDTGKNPANGTSQPEEKNSDTSKPLKKARPANKIEKKEKKVMKAGDGEVVLKAFTGMPIGVFPIKKETAKYIIIETNRGPLKFDKATMKQVEADNPKFANKIELGE